MDKSDDIISGEVVGVRQYGSCIILFVDEGDGCLVPIPFELSHWQSAFNENPPESHDLVGRRIRYDGDSVVYLDDAKSVRKAMSQGEKP